MPTTETQNVISPRSSSTSPELLDVLVFVIPCIQFIQVKVVGTLSGSDILLLVTALYLVARGKIEINTALGKWLMALCSLWLAAQCVTDFVRHTPFSDYARGWSNIGMTIVNASVIWTLLYGRIQRIAIYGWGLVVGSLLAYLIVPDEFTADYPWKFGLAFPVTLGVFLLVSRSKWKSHWPIVAIFMIGVTNIYLGARNRGGACLAAALYVAMIHSIGRDSMNVVKLRPKTIAAIVATIALGAGGVFWMYQYSASRGLLGPKARQEYETQSSGQYGLLIGGRTEMLASIPAIIDSPFLGHGSWARDPTYLIAERQALALMGYENASEISTNDVEEGIIPSHSYLFGAWVNAGIVGAIFWGWIFIIVVRALMRVYPRSVLLLPLMAYTGFSMLWDILFSPYGATTRIIFPYCIVVLATCMGTVPSRPSQNTV